MIYILAFIVLIGVIVFVHELGHYLAARSVGVTVEKFSIGMPPTIYNFKPKNSKTVFAIGALPLGGYVKMKGLLDESMDSSFSGEDDELESKSPLQKIWVMSAGVIMNILLAFLVFVIIGKMNGEPVILNDDTTIDYVVPNSPAFEGGLNEGDMVISINATNVKTWDEFTTIIKQSPNTTLSMVIIRDGNEIQKNITPLSAPDIASGRVDQVIGKLGVDKKREIKDLSFIESFQYGFDQTIWSMILMTTSLKMIFTGNVSRDDVGSVIMIGQMAGEAAQAGLTPFLMLMALISVNLAFINILPIPALDGGQIMVILIEMLLGKPLSIKTRMRIQSVGMYFLLALMAFLIINDILRVLS
ncbi:MAG: RIP metalloprotease RseP [Candidatus Neomarinimicrobiota bacterium]|nr:RIP metalloprotease RseP [Candidatus Neomarinimicrobiota bacterium]